MADKGLLLVATKCTHFLQSITRPREGMQYSDTIFLGALLMPILSQFLIKTSISIFSDLYHFVWRLHSLLGDYYQAIKVRSIGVNITYWKCNFPMTWSLMSVGRLVGRSVGWFVGLFWRDFLKERKVTLLCSYRSYSMLLHQFGYYSKPILILICILFAFHFHLHFYFLNNSTIIVTSGKVLFLRLHCVYFFSEF